MQQAHSCTRPEFWGLTVSTHAQWGRPESLWLPLLLPRLNTLLHNPPRATRLHVSID